MTRRDSPLLALCLLVGCAACRPAVILTKTATTAPAPAPAIELVESSPVETSLDHPDVREAAEVWPELIGRAQRSIDLAEFYASGDLTTPLAPTLRALAAAVRRGVRVRLLVDASMSATYPETLAWLTGHGVAVRPLDLRPRTGGVLHAKYFVIDGREAYVGSQNLDWRSLAHIHELGLRLGDPRLAAALDGLFAADWALAAGDPTPLARLPAVAVEPIEVAAQGGPARVALGYSPRPLLPGGDEHAWDLRGLLDVIEHAERTLRIELLIYHGPEEGDPDGPMGQVQAALVAAARRGVAVELLLSDWMRKPTNIARLRPLLATPGVAIRIVTVPRAAAGEIPFARLIHAKYVVADGRRLWLSTSNLEDRYFTRSRNLSVLVDSAALAGRAERIFTDLWNSRYADPVS